MSPPPLPVSLIVYLEGKKQRRKRVNFVWPKPAGKRKSQVYTCWGEERIQFLLHNSSGQFFSSGVLGAHKGSTWVCVTPHAIKGIKMLPKFSSLSGWTWMIQYNSDEILTANSDCFLYEGSYGSIWIVSFSPGDYTGREVLSFQMSGDQGGETRGTSVDSNSSGVPSCQPLLVPTLYEPRF